MEDWAIRAEGLSKVYRLYSKPLHRMLDLFGLLPRRLNLYGEHAAVSGVNLEIRRGEKVAIIGRNGAGKSTLLKMISGVVTPSTGSIQINGTVHALLNLGTGFHQDFTGRDNVYSYLAHIGITGERADKLFREIADFAELHEYIDQPTKTYSAGMNMRLAFATSTVIDPDILVIDEVLSVGDGYFAKKSFDRMRELCDSGHTTLILVTHDIYTATAVCDRFIWLDRGAVLLDGDMKTVTDRYESSIRDDHERSLRAIRVGALEHNAQAPVKPFYGQIRCSGNMPIDRPLPIRRLSLRDGATIYGDLRPGHIDEDGAMSLLLDRAEGNWGNTEVGEAETDGPYRAFAPFGSIFHRAPFLVQSSHLASSPLENLVLDIEYRDDAAAPGVVELLPPSGNWRFAAPLGNTGAGGWRTESIVLTRQTALETAEAPFPRYGTQALRITDVRFLDAEGAECHVFRTGQPMRIRLAYSVEDESFSERPLIMLAFTKDGSVKSNRFVLDDYLIDAAERREGTLELVADQLLLAPGRYLINVVVMREGAYAPVERNVYFTVNDRVLDVHNRAYEIGVENAENGPQTHNVVFHHPARWLVG